MLIGNFFEALIIASVLARISSMLEKALRRTIMNKRAPREKNEDVSLGRSIGARFASVCGGTFNGSRTILA
jgi:hypothetical protein